MDFESIKRFLSLFLTALGLFVFIAIIWSVFIITKYAKRPVKVNDTKANEIINSIPTQATVK